MISKNLLHLTYGIFAKSIKITGFNKSFHLPEKHKVQWLGDGVYFYNDKDTQALKQGLSLLRNKKDRPIDNVVGVKVDILLEQDNILNILDSDDVEFIKNYILNKSYIFMSLGNHDLCDSFSDYLFVLDHIDRFLPFNNKFHGIALGSLINEFMEELEGVTIKMISCSFVTNIKHRGRKNKAIQQHCVTELEYLDKSRNYEIVKI